MDFDFGFDIIDDDDLDALELIVNGIPRRIYERADYFNSFDEMNFFKRFRLTKNTVQQLLTNIDHELEFPYDLNNCVSPINQILVTLHYYATGNHLLSVADFSGMHTSTASRIILRVSRAIARLYHRYIKMPVTAEEIIQTQNEFYAVASFPRVVGAIDCTHVKIQSPGGQDPEIFRNRKGYFSLNIQAVCNAKLKISNIISRWPGSVHDATIFNNSYLKVQFETGLFGNSLLLGDSGYPLRKYILTPLLNPNTPDQQLYDEAHIRTRNTIERLFGVLKRRFPVLAYGCRLKLDTVLTIVVAASILHNMAVEAGENNPPIPDDMNDEMFDHLVAEGRMPPVHQIEDNENTGLQVRNNIIQNYFHNL